MRDTLRETLRLIRARATQSPRDTAFDTGYRDGLLSAATMIENTLRAAPSGEGVRDWIAEEIRVTLGWSKGGAGSTEFELADRILARIHDGAPAPSYPEWRTMESAPRDGTSVLAWWRLAGDDYTPHVVHYGSMADGEAGWYDDYRAPFSEPTHWTPIPAAPEGSRE